MLITIKGSSMRQTIFLCTSTQNYLLAYLQLLLAKQMKKPSFRASNQFNQFIMAFRWIARLHKWNWDLQMRQKSPLKVADKWEFEREAYMNKDSARNPLY